MSEFRGFALDRHRDRMSALPGMRSGFRGFALEVGADRMSALPGMSTALFLVFLTLVGCLGAFGQHSASAERANLSKATAATRNVVVPAGWLWFWPATKSFRVLMPKEPTREVSKSTISESVEVTTDAYTASNDDGVFVVAYVKDLPLESAKMSEASRQALYEAIWKGMAEGIRVGLEKNGLTFKVELLGVPVKSTVSGYEGRGQDFTIGPLQGKAQMILLGHHAYVLLSVLADEKAIAHRNTFFDSFEIKTKVVN
jgi:hypothetical protein